MKLTVLFKHRVFANTGWLSLLQFTNLVIPLFALPYVTRVLGASQYGVFAVALNLVMYGQVLVEYGFTLTGSRKVALARDQSELAHTVSSIVTAEALLCAAAAAILIVAAGLAGVSTQVRSCMYLLFAIPLAEVFRQAWVFQGLQRMKTIAVATSVVRVLSTVLVFVLVKNSDDLLLYCALYASSFVLTAAVSAVLVRVSLGIRIRAVSLADALKQLAEGWPLFTTAAMSLLFTGVGITVLGLFVSDREVGMYAAIQKIPTVLVLLYAPLGQALFPHVSGKYELSFADGYLLVKRVARYVLGFAAIIGGGLILFRVELVETVYGHDFAGGASLMIPLAVWLFFSIANNLMGIQVMVSSGHSREYSRSFALATVAIVCLSLVLGRTLGAVGVASATMAAELLLTLLLLLRIRGMRQEAQRLRDPIKPL